MVTMNWLQIIMARLNEDFIDEDGNALGADGDVGDFNHDMRAMEHMIFASIEDTENIPSFDVYDLTDEQLRQIDANFPGFMESVWGGELLPKEFAVKSIGWIRVIGSNFEVQIVDENALKRIVDYISENPLDGPDLHINERSTQNYVSMQFLELSEAVHSGQGIMKYQFQARRPQGLY